jgi:hypothetical protein
MTQIKQNNTDLFYNLYNYYICENLFNLCHLCAKNTKI